jgi:hypothetical protein
MPAPPPSPASPDCDPNWTLVSSPNFDSHGNGLNAVAVISANDVWAVGYYLNDAGTAQTLIEHWNGSTWSVVYSPNSGQGANVLKGVAAVSSSDVWAVGYSTNTIGGTRGTLVEHWSGTGTNWEEVSSQNLCCHDNILTGVAAVAANNIWVVGYDYDSTLTAQTLVEHWTQSSGQFVIVTSPNVGTHDNFLQAVSARSATDIWAVGYYVNNSSTDQALIEHWDGTSWSVVPAPTLANNHLLNGVAAIGMNNVWAVGFQLDNSNTHRTLIERWNGSVWSIVSSPNQGALDNDLNAISAAAANDVWAVGNHLNTSNALRTLVEHWDGTSWSVVTTPAVDNADDVVLMGVDALSNTNVWGVGNYSYDNRTTSQSLAKHWDGTSWSMPSTPTIGTNENYLKAVSALSSSDVWTVGYYNGPAGNRTLIEHWDGTSWHVVSSPNVGTGLNQLYGVAAISGTDAWAVGYYNNGPASQTLTEHWDGSAWSIVPSLNPATSVSILTGAAAVAGNDVWAVGYYSNGTYEQTLIERWNGSAWSVVPSPNIATNNNYLYAVSAASGGDVWAVGDYYSSPSDPEKTLMEHWNGSVWSIVPSPNAGTDDYNYLYGVAAVSSADVWAVGYYDSGVTGRTLIEHWNGTAWSLASSPNVGASGNYLSAVSAASGGDVWAVGSYFSDSAHAYRSLVEHWNGTSWNVVPSPNQDGLDNDLLGVDAVSGSDVWAVGTYPNSNSNHQSRTLIERYNPCVPVCPVPFEDVPNPSTFYEYVQCLACRGVISGYACGSTGEPCNTNHDPYFRPNNNVTRGQIAKIIALSKGIVGYVSGQTFEDVPPGSTFYTYTEQLYALQAMSGYPCGGVGEPCNPPTNRPYFRPNSNATRGQLAKIDSNAAGYSDIPTGQTFEDVPPASTFYTYTQRLTIRGVMNGYTCGSPEPCVPPNNRPYFRPNSNVTRGQTSKIVANTFYPDCQSLSAKHPH